MAIEFHYAPGATPLDPDEAAGLASGLYLGESTRAELQLPDAKN